MRDRIIVALDVPDAASALAMADRIGPACTFYKVGLELYTAEGPAVVASLRDLGKNVFLDLKLHDIPNQVARATARAGDLGVRFLTVHASGGGAMLAAAAAACPKSLQLLAVTVLTSFDAAGLGAVYGRPVAEVGAEADRLAALARDAGIGGVVCAASEAGRVRAVMGPDAWIVTPGIRLAGDPHHDQRRVRTAGQAFRTGSTHIVVGRPVTASGDPRGAFERIAAEAETRS
ncbi:MAG: orotidine-5'-phosphate decarboxylase [Gemmatimonadetes bacterium]|nr:orotidine-5'-phosphate decarboxylase [Gemmatimonadota bacterium]MYC91717.1 orotidine-5'-phosphate decarboxylase [Gemmatimonadota bacterium]MYG35970.1 orotidine-5'-phosphate decarboxylase [Gemmatimonadota bacterium]